MNKKELEAFAKQAAKSIKTEADLTDFRKMLTKVTVEAAFSNTCLNNLSIRITVMVIHLKPFVQKMARLI